MKKFILFLLAACLSCSLAYGQTQIDLSQQKGVVPQANGGTGSSIGLNPWSPSILGVPWSGDLNAIAAQVINVKTDPRVSPLAVGNGSTDDTAAIRAAIVVATSLGGATLYFPAGDFKIIASSDPTAPSQLIIPANIILRGVSRTLTTIHMNDLAPTSNDNTATWGGVHITGSKVGMSDLTFIAVASGASSATCPALWNRGAVGATDIFFNNVSMQLGTCKPLWIDGTTNLLLLNSTIDTQTQANTGPIYFGLNDVNISIIGNTFTYNYGRVHILNANTVLYKNNAIIRNALSRYLNDGNSPAVWESGGLEFSFDKSMQIIGNSFTTLNFLPGEVGDGEALMTQNTQAIFTDAGTITSVGANTLTDSGAAWGATSTARLASFPDTFVVITSGAQMGEMKTIASMNTSTKTLTLTQPWDVIPSTGVSYAITTTSARDIVIRDNTFSSGPHGIIIWDGCVNCLIEHNTLTDSNSILMRTFDNVTGGETRRYHEVTINVNVLGNTLSSVDGVRDAAILLSASGNGGDSYPGMSSYNVSIGNNVINPFPQNPSVAISGSIEEASQSGFYPCWTWGPSGKPTIAALQNIHFWNNVQTLPVTYTYPGDGTSGSPGTQTSCVTSNDVWPVAAQNYAVDTGAANVLVVTLGPEATHLVTGMEVKFLPAHANSTTTPTLNLNATGAKTITKFGTAALTAGDLSTTAVAAVIYDGTNWQLQNPQVGR